MKVHRRGFLGISFGTILSKPKLPPLEGIDVLNPPAGGSEFADAVGSSPESKEWAKDALKKWVNRSPQEKDRRRRQFYVHNIDATVYPLRSMSFINKYRISRDIQFERSERSHESYLRGILKGWWT